MNPSFDRGYGVVVDNSGYVYITGEAGNGRSIDYLTIKYAQAPGINEVAGVSFLPLLSIRSSVFCCDIEIKYYISRSGNILLQIYDISGCLIKTLVKDNMNKGEYRVRWQGVDDQDQKVPAGVYFVCLYTDKDTRSEQVVLLR